MACSAVSNPRIVDSVFVEEQTVQQKCSLCKRNRPVFAEDKDITRLPLAMLTPFLKKLRADTIKKKQYLH